MVVFNCPLILHKKEVRRLVAMKEKTLLCMDCKIIIKKLEVSRGFWRSFKDQERAREVLGILAGPAH